MEIKAKDIRLVDIDSLVLNTKNNNKHPPEQIERLAKLIRHHGFRNPLVVSNRSGFVLCGHGRIEAAKKAGLKEIPVMFQDFSNEAEEYSYLTSDNAIASWAELDLAMVNQEMLELGPDFDIDMLGIKDFVIEPIEKFEPQSDEDDVPEVTHPITRRGDIWLLGNHRLMCGDSTMIDDVEKLMNGEKADMVFTDPPYGDNHAMSNMVKSSDRKRGKSIVASVEKIKNDDDITFLSEVSSSIFPFLVEKFSAFVFFKWNKWEKIKEYFSVFGEPKTVCVWDRDSQGASTFRINPVHEFCFYWGTLGDKKEKGNLRNVWRCRKERNSAEMHPTVKPIEIIEMPIRMCCEEGKIVLDSFLGSGSTLIACEKTNRKCYGMELDEKYCDVIINRWQNYTGKKATLELTGQTYKELKAERENHIL